MSLELFVKQLGVVERKRKKVKNAGQLTLGMESVVYRTFKLF